ncbi:antitoxin [Streptomyces somaliensis]|uniref:antitoxin n=1 Tax=Streptomyces somaliensis TaxID=78355 RepID=UPI0020CF38C4|nr:antitoxin [Streptomyces somaliensis]MCP9946942.1 antitoxin [Streptomyces somaliensis]MCP9963578.1 antitoxin [Streptomyces somaliensis]MCP9976088.1 antitoxin [Streptomyces somaliensis]
MSVMGKIKNMLKGHEGQVGKGVDEAGDHADRKTRGRHSRHVDAVQEQVKGRLGRDRGRHREPPAGT